LFSDLITGVRIKPPCSLSRYSVLEKSRLQCGGVGGGGGDREYDDGYDVDDDDDIQMRVKIIAEKTRHVALRVVLTSH